jgi:hypothetical protein
MRVAGVLVSKFGELEKWNLLFRGKCECEME